MTRASLPTRRAADEIVFEHGNRLWRVAFGRFPDGRPAELFLDGGSVDPLSELAKESAIVASLALQSGCPFETLRHALDGRDAGPIGTALALIEG